MSSLNPPSATSPPPRIIAVKADDKKIERGGGGHVEQKGSCELSPCIGSSSLQHHPDLDYEDEFEAASGNRKWSAESGIGSLGEEEEEDDDEEEEVVDEIEPDLDSGQGGQEEDEEEGAATHAEKSVVERIRSKCNYCKIDLIFKDLERPYKVSKSIFVGGMRFVLD